MDNQPVIRALNRIQNQLRETEQHRREAPNATISVWLSEMAKAKLERNIAIHLRDTEKQREWEMRIDAMLESMGYTAVYRHELPE
jgi:hypothetical protein